MKIKEFLVQLIVILVLSVVVALGYNLFSGSSLPIFKKYNPKQADASGEDLTVYFDEIDVETLETLKESEMAVLVDARTAGDFEEGHIPGAISLPISEFKEKYDTAAGFLVKDKSIIIYCIGVNCIDSSLLAKELSKKGHREIYVYKGGIEEWESLGNPVEKSGESSGGMEN